MKFCPTRLIVVALFAAFIAPRLIIAQEALETKPDDATPEPTPIEESTPEPKKKAKPKEEATSTNVENMSPDQFKKAGLDKLSPAELRTLNEWLKGYRHVAETTAAAQATEQTKKQAKEEATAEAKKGFNRSWIRTDRIFSRVDGEFHGLMGSKKLVIRLEDGTVWKQANGTDHFEARITDHPPVMVVHSGIGYKMHVIGTGEFYVNPVR